MPRGRAETAESTLGGRKREPEGGLWLRGAIGGVVGSANALRMARMGGSAAAYCGHGWTGRLRFTTVPSYILHLNSLSFA